MSNPVLSFLSSDYKFKISPFAKTASKPVILALKGPCFIKYLPAA